MKATIEDLKRERWLRARNSGELVWTTKEGKEIPIKDMSDSHIDNVIHYHSMKQAYEDAHYDWRFD